MDKRILTYVATAVLICLSAISFQAKKIVNPTFKSRTSSVLTIEEMDLGKKETTVKFRAIFRPGYWFYLDNDSYLLDPATGEKFHPLPGQSILGEKVMMPESGDTTITVKYPPIPKGVKTLDFSPKSVFHTFGISLSDKKQHSSTIAPEEILNSATPRKPTPSFFKGGDVRIHGKMKGYDPRLGFDALKIYLEDLPIHESSVELIPLDSCGNFDETFFISSPLTTFIPLQFGTYIQTYLEPDNDLELLIDWEDLLDIDRKKGLKEKLEHIQFGGSLTDMNRMLFGLPTREGIIGSRFAESASPLEAEIYIVNKATERKKELERYATKIKADSFMRKYLREMALIEEAANMLEYDSYKNMERHSLPDSLFFKDLLPTEFFEDFLPALLNADTTILAQPYASLVLNRLSFSTLPEVLEVKTTRYGEGDEAKEMPKAIMKFAGANDVPFLWQIAMAAKNGQSIKHSARAYPELYRNSLDNLFSHTIISPYLRQRLEQTYTEEVNLKTYDLPDTPGGNLMRELIKPYYGKWLMVDFWATTCGPCRSNIEDMKEFRDLNRDNESFTFLFLTADDESSLQNYNDYVEKNLKGEHSLRLKSQEMDKIRALFNITGIPRYVLFDPEGRVADRNFSTFAIYQFLEEKNIPFNKPEPKVIESGSSGVVVIEKAE